MKKKQQGIGNEGFTLMEVIVSMVILGLVFIPLMKYFSDSLKYAAITAQKQNATLTAQEIVEFFKGKDLLITRQGVKESSSSDKTVMIYNISDELKDLFGVDDSMTEADLQTAQPNYQPDTGVGELEYTYQTEASNGNRYDVKVNLKTDISANEVARPIIYGIDETKTVVASEGTEFEDAVVYFLGAHMSALTRQGDEIADVPAASPLPSASPGPSESSDASDPSEEPDGPAATPEPLVELTEDEIRDRIERTIKVTVEKSDPAVDLLLGTTYLRVIVEYEYSCLGITSMTNEDEYPVTIVDQTIEELESIYLMFNLLDEQKDEIIIDWQADPPASAAEAPEFVLICQNLQKDDGTFYTYDPLTLRFKGNFINEWPWSNGNCEVRTNICDTENPTDPEKNHGSIKLVELGYAVGTYNLDCKPLTTSGTSVRLIQITVNVYKEGDLDEGGDPLATVITTKGE